MNRRFAVGLASVALCLGGLVVTQAGAATKTVSASGGSVTLTAMVRNAKTCGWSSSPKIAGFAKTVKCKTGTVARSARFTATTTTTAKSYAITLIVRGKTTTVDHWRVIQAGQTTTTTVATPAPINLSGTGQTATSAITVESGLAVFHASCSACQANFIVEIDNANGSLVDIPINVIGSYSGSIAEGLPAGQYILSVTADQGIPWTVQITQPRDVAGMPLPTTLTGLGQEVVGPVAGGSSLRIQATNTATQGGNFIVEVLGANGSMQGIPINEIGSYSGSTIANFLSGGPYYLEINSDGAWSITVSSG